MKNTPEEIIARFKPFNMSGIDLEAVKKVAQGIATAQSPETKQMFEDILKQFEAKAAILETSVDDPAVYVPDEEPGDLTFGYYMQLGKTFHPCNIKIDDLCMTSVNAGVGKGKTNLFFHLCREVDKYSIGKPVEQRIGLIIPERVKKDFRNMDLNQSVLDLRDMRINFFWPPPGVRTDLWISEICNAIMHVWALMYASRNYFTTVVNRLLGQTVPTFDEVYQEIKKDNTTFGRKTDRASQMEEIVLDRLEQTRRQFGRCLDARKTMQLHEFIDNRIHLVIEADVTPDSFALLLTWLLLYIYYYNKYNNHRGNLSNGGTLLVCDEAYVIWDMLKGYSTDRKEIGPDFISLSPLYLRDFRCGILAGSQRPLHADYQASVNLRGVGCSSDYKDSQLYANFLGEPKLLKYIMKLGKGEFLIKNGDKEAALVKIPFVPFRNNKRMTDEELAPFMFETKRAILEYCREHEPQREKGVIISDTVKSFLRDIWAFPDSQLKDRYDRLRLKDSGQQAALMVVLQSGYVAMVRDNLHSKKQSKYLVATQKGIEWLRSDGKDTLDIENEGGMGHYHSLYQTTLLLRLRAKGLPAEKEKFVAEKKIDVVSHLIGYEIAVTGDVDVFRVMSALPKLDEYWFLCQSAIIEQSMKSRIPDPKVKTAIASDFLLGLLRSNTNSNQNTPNNPNNQESGSDSDEKEKNN